MSRPMLLAFLAALCLGLASGGGARAFEPLDGRFLAERVCETGRAIRDIGSGGAQVEPGQEYEILGKNRARATHVRIVLDGRPVWVGVECGRLTGRGKDEAGVVRSLPAREETDSVLAVTWQPAFCETWRGRLPPECRALEAGRLPSAERGFTLHGLWPQPFGNFWCGATEAEKMASEAGDWDRLPEPELSQGTRARLRESMPGAVSGLHRHQWVKHGGCYGAEGGAEEYFADSLWLMEQLNGSALAALFAETAGRRLTAGEIRAAADAAFGRGAGDRVEIRCDDGLIEELHIHLEGRITAGETTLGVLMRAAPPTRSGCRGGRVDRAGD